MATTNNPTEMITIDLDEPLLSRASNGNQIQVKAVNRLTELLNIFKKQADEHENPTEWFEREFNPPRFNNTVFISGQRGAGKTTFLRSVLKAEAANTATGRLPLALIDPTLVNTNEHILVQIVAKIHARVNENLNCCLNQAENEKFHTSLEKMQEGLKLLARKKGAESEDAAWFLNKALKHAVGGQGLEQAFHELLETAAAILKVKLFIIAFDDVDTDTSQAFEVLELIRRYLTSPRLVVLITGDPALYSYLVMRNRANELQENGKSEDIEFIKNKTSDLVEHLEQQYLAKIFPIEYRIELKNIADLISVNANDHSIIKFKSNKIGDELKEIRSYFGELFSSCLYLREIDVKTYTDFLLKQPIRTVLQIAKSTHLTSDAVEKQNALIMALKNSYLGAALKENIDLDGVIENETHPHIIAYSQFLICNRYGELETGFYCRSDGNSNSYNAVQIILASVIGRELKTDNNSKNRLVKVGKALHLMLAGPASCNIFMNNVLGEHEFTTLGKSELKDLETNFINYIGINRFQGAFNLAAHFSALNLNPNISPQSIQIQGGIVRVVRNQGVVLAHYDRAIQLITEGKDITIDTPSSPLSRGIDKLIKLHGTAPEDDLECKHWMIAAVVMASHSTTNKSGVVNYVSIYCLLATISELLFADNLTDLGKVVSQRMAQQHYGAPHFLKGKNNVGAESDELDEDGIDDGDARGYNNKITSEILIWKKQNGDSDFSLSALLIGKIWSRVFYSIENISDDLQTKHVKDHHKDPLLGAVMQRFVWALLNAFIVEEYKYRKTVVNSSVDASVDFFSAKNPNTSANELVFNINQIVSKQKSNTDFKFSVDMPLSTLLLNCPLLKCFIEPESPLDKVISENLIGHVTSNPEALKQFFHGKVQISRLPIVGCFKNKPTKK